MIKIREIDHVVLRVKCLRVEPFDQEAIVGHLRRDGVPVGDIKPPA